MTHSTKLLRIAAVADRVGLSRSTIYALTKLGQFPARIRVSANVVAWVAHEVEAWIAERIASQRVRSSAVAQPVGVTGV